MNPNNNEGSFFQIIILLLSVISISIILLDFFIVTSNEVSIIIQLADFVICILFLVDFIYRFIRANKKLQFMKWGWIDLLSSIPMFDIFRAGRLVRILRMVKLLRIFRSGKILYSYIIKNKRKNMVLSAVLLSILLLFAGSVSILICESGNAAANIITAEDAIWWTVFTMSTVGYRDLYPVTLEGKVIATFLMVSGIGLFGVFTGLITSCFVGKE